MSSAVWPSHDWIAAGCGEIVKVWDPSDPRAEVKIYEGTTVSSISFSHNNKVLAVAGDQGQINVHSSKPNDAGNRNVGSFPPTPEVGIEAFSCVVFAPNGRQLAAGTTNGLLRIWDMPGVSPYVLHVPNPTSASSAWQ